jgi:DNA-binding ferritin-like protein (Dps family)
MITTTSTAFERELQKLIQDRIANLSDNLLGGLAISNMEQYREQVGRIAELKNVLSLCEEAASAVNKTR